MWVQILVFLYTVLAQRLAAIGRHMRWREASCIEQLLMLTKTATGCSPVPWSKNQRRGRGQMWCPEPGHKYTCFRKLSRDWSLAEHWASDVIFSGQQGAKWPPEIDKNSCVLLLFNSYSTNEIFIRMLTCLHEWGCLEHRIIKKMCGFTSPLNRCAFKIVTWQRCYFGYFNFAILQYCRYCYSPTPGWVWYGMLWHILLWFSFSE